MCATTAPSNGCGSRAWAVPFERGDTSTLVDPIVFEAIRASK
jgi:hypothetical protein